MERNPVQDRWMFAVIGVQLMSPAIYAVSLLVEGVKGMMR